MSIVTVRRDGREETHDVKEVEHSTHNYDDNSPHEVGDEFWVLRDIYPSQTEIIGSDLVWLSGSMADPRDWEGERSPFPLVYIPKDGEYEVEVDD